LRLVNLDAPKAHQSSDPEEIREELKNVMLNQKLMRKRLLVVGLALIATMGIVRASRPERQQKASVGSHVLRVTGTELIKAKVDALPDDDGQGSGAMRMGQRIAKQGIQHALDEVKTRQVAGGDEQLNQILAELDRRQDERIKKLP